MRLNNILLNSSQVKGVSRKIKTYLELTKNANTTYQNVRDTTKAVLRRNFIVLNAYSRKEERSKINNVICHLRKLGKEVIYLGSGTSMASGSK